jgi:membrane protein DedA with SNARE-associated domain
VIVLLLRKPSTNTNTHASLCGFLDQPANKNRCLKILSISLVFCLTLLIALSGWRQSVASDSARGVSSAAVEDYRSTAVQDFERSLAKMQPLLERYGYGAAVVATMAEGMGIPTPGQTLLMASALEAAQGRMNIVLLLFLVTTAATLGNSVGYAIGRWGGRMVLDKLRVNPHRQQYLDDLFKRRGGPVILLARFLDGVRQLNGIVAGVMRMPWWTFTAYNVLGAILWTFAWGLGTYYFGRDIHVIAAFFHRHGWFLYVLGVIAFVVLVVYLLRSRGKGVER